MHIIKEMSTFALSNIKRVPQCEAEIIPSYLMQLILPEGLSR